MLPTRHQPFAHFASDRSRETRAATWWPKLSRPFSERLPAWQGPSGTPGTISGSGCGTADTTRAGSADRDDRLKNWTPVSDFWFWTHMHKIHKKPSGIWDTQTKPLYHPSPRPFSQTHGFNTSCHRYIFSGKCCTASLINGNILVRSRIVNFAHCRF